MFSYIIQECQMESTTPLWCTIGDTTFAILLITINNY